jgi:hypothetical protein
MPEPTMTGIPLPASAPGPAKMRLIAASRILQDVPDDAVMLSAPAFLQNEETDSQAKAKRRSVKNKPGKLKFELQT